VVPLAAFLAALGAMALVYQLARVGGRTPVVTLLLAGFAVSTMLGYGVSFMLIVNDRMQLSLPRVYAWLLGGVSITAWSELLVVGPLIALTALASLGFGRSLNAFSLGEEMAEQLGIAVEREKLLLIVAGSL